MFECLMTCSKWLTNGSLRMIMAKHTMLHCFLQNDNAKHKISAIYCMFFVLAMIILLKTYGFGSWNIVIFDIKTLENFEYRMNFLNVVWRFKNGKVWSKFTNIQIRQSVSRNLIGCFLIWVWFLGTNWTVISASSRVRENDSFRLATTALRLATTALRLETTPLRLATKAWQLETTRCDSRLRRLRLATTTWQLETTVATRNHSVTSRNLLVATRDQLVASGLSILVIGPFLC